MSLVRRRRWPSACPENQTGIEKRALRTESAPFNLHTSSAFPAAKILPVGFADHFFIPAHTIPRSPKARPERGPRTMTRSYWPQGIGSRSNSRAVRLARTICLASQGSRAEPRSATAIVPAIIYLPECHTEGALTGQRQHIEISRYVDGKFVAS